MYNRNDDFLAKDNMIHVTGITKMKKGFDYGNCTDHRSHPDS